MNTFESNPEILEARKKMAEKFGNLRIGGKGKVSANIQVPKEGRKCPNTSPPRSKTRKFSH